MTKFNSMSWQSLEERLHQAEELYECKDSNEKKKNLHPIWHRVPPPPFAPPVGVDVTSHRPILVMQVLIVLHLLHKQDVPCQYHGFGELGKQLNLVGN